MRAPSLPLPPLIAALRQAAVDGTPGSALTDALGLLAAHLGADGIRLALDQADPLPALEAGWGSLAAGASGTSRALTSEGRRVGRLWVAGGRELADRAIEAAQAAVEAARAHLRAERAEGNLVALDAAVRGIAGVLSTERVLQLIVDRVRELAGARYAALGIVGEEGRIDAFLTSGITAEQRRRIGDLPHGRGLLGLIIREGQSFRIRDIATDPRRYGFPPNHPEMHSFLGVPVQVRGRPVGNLYLTDKIGQPEFSADDQRLVERFALHAGIAIENARLHEQVRRLVVVEERERIGRDLHDGIIQRIYGVNLSLDEVPELVRTDPGEAARRVDAAIDSLNTAIAEIRQFIYILRPPPTAEGALVAALRALAAEVRMHASLEVDVLADEVPRLPGETTSQLVSIAREALSNAVRHAAATRVDISLDARPGALELAISDDGTGFDVAAPLADSHRGLGNMGERAERLGATLRIVSRAGIGTRVIVTVPIQGAQAGVGGTAQQ